MITINWTAINVSINESINVSGDLLMQGGSRLCVTETYSMNMIMLGILNALTLFAMAYLQDHGHPDLASRLINILFASNVAAIAGNVLIMIGVPFWGLPSS